MSELGVLILERREKPNSRKSKQMRRVGYLPGAISSKGKDSISVKVKTDELRKGLSSYGRNALFKLTLGNEDVTGMVKDIQMSPVKGTMLHVDFQEVSLTEEIKVDLAIALTGLEELEHKKFMALRQSDTIAVRGLPQDIPDDIAIDLSNIDKVENIYLKDVEFPKGIVPDGDLEQVLISIVEVKQIGVEDDEAVTEATGVEETGEEV